MPQQTKPIHPQCNCTFETEEDVDEHVKRIYQATNCLITHLQQHGEQDQICVHNAAVIAAVNLLSVCRNLPEDDRQTVMNQAIDLAERLITEQETNHVCDRIH